MPFCKSGKIRRAFADSREDVIIKLFLQMFKGIWKTDRLGVRVDL